MAKIKLIKTQFQGIFSYETKKGTRFSIRVKFKDDIGKWRERSESGFETLKKAKKRKIELESLVQNEMNSVLDSDKITFKEWFQNYYELTSPTWSADTLNKINGYYKNHLREFDNIPIQKITLHSYQQFINKKLYKDNLSLSTTKALHSQIMAIMNSAVRHEVLKKNKLNQVTIHKDYVPKKKNIEINKLLEFDTIARNTFDVLEYGMYILTRIGWRRGEVMGLTRGAIKIINDDCVEVSVLKTRTANAPQGKGPKTLSSYRTNPLTGEMAHAIIDAALFSEKIYTRFKKEWNDDSFIFINHKDCEPFFPTHLGRVLSKVGKRIGIKVHPHMFRHTFVTLALENKKNPVSIAQWVGHAKIDMTLNTYSHSTEKSKNELITFANDGYLE